MAGEQVRGSLKLSGAGQLPGGFSAGGTTAAHPAVTPPTSPTTFTAPGVHLFGVPRGVTSVTITQLGGGGAGGGNGADGNGATGGGSGAYAKYTFGSPLIQPGGIITVHVGAGGLDHLTDASATYCLTNRGEAKVTSGFGVRGDTGGAGGTNVVVSEPGLTTTTKTSGAAGATSVTASGGAGGTAPNGGAGGDGGKNGEQGLAGDAPGGGGGGAGNGSMNGGRGADGQVVITWA